MPDDEHDEGTKRHFQAIVNTFSQNVLFAKSELYKDKPRQLEFGFMCGSDLNAFAYASPPSNSLPFDFIGMNVGIIFTLLGIFGRILAHPQNFPDVGDSSKENPSPPTIAFLSTDVMQSGYVACAPKCRIRSGFASLLTQVALDFLFFHELTHLRNGHLEYVRASLRLNHWPEAMAHSSNESDFLTRQTLEMDADCGAVLLSLNKAFTLKANLASVPHSIQVETKEAMLAAFGSAKQATQTVQFAAYLLFRLFDTECIWFEQSKKTHPPHAIRMTWIGATLYEIFNTRNAYKYCGEEFKIHGAQTVLSAEVACANLLGNQPDLRMLRSVVINSQHLEYLDKLKANWKSLRPVLELHKRGGNLAA